MRRRAATTRHWHCARAPQRRALFRCARGRAPRAAPAFSAGQSSIATRVSLNSTPPAGSARRALTVAKEANTSGDQVCAWLRACARAYRGSRGRRKPSSRAGVGKTRQQ